MPQDAPAAPSLAMIVTPEPMTLPSLADYGFAFDVNGLTLTRQPTVEQFKCAGFMLGVYGQQMSARSRAWQLAFGDWLNYGENLFGEAASQYFDEVCEGVLNWDVDTLTGYKAVALRISFPLRRVELDYSHFKEIAYGVHKSEDRPAWIDWAAEEQVKRKAEGQRRLSVRELREAIQAAQARDVTTPDQDQDESDDADEDGEDAPKMVVCPHCHREFELQ